MNDLFSSIWLAAYVFFSENLIYVLSCILYLLSFVDAVLLGLFTLMQYFSLTLSLALTKRGALNISWEGFDNVVFYHLQRYILL
jgi:hypothetical protein